MPSPRDPPSPEYSNLDCAFPPFPISKSGTPRSGTPVKESKPFESDFNNDYVREHAEPFNMSPEPYRDGSRHFSNHSRGRSITSARSRSGSVFGTRDKSVPRPSTANSHRRGPSLSSLSGGPKSSLRSQPPVPSLPSNGEFTQTPKFDGTSTTPIIGRLPFSRRIDHEFDHKEGTTRTNGGYGRLDEDEPMSTVSNPYNRYRYESVSRSSQDERNNTNNRRPPPLTNDKSLPLRPTERSVPSPTRSQTYPIRNEDRDSNSSLSKSLPRRPSEPSTSSYRHRQSRSEFDVESERISRRDKFVFSPDEPNTHRPSNDFYPPRSSSRKRRPSNLRPGAVPPLPDLALDFDVGNPYHTASDSSSSHASSISAARTRSSRSSPPPPDEFGHKRSGTTDRNVLDSDFPAPLRVKPFEPPESPTDPLMQAGRLSPLPRLDYNKSMRSNAPSTVSDMSSSSRPRRNPTLASKGSCRGCNQPITGKSISSADGRLTGRYHKECFVCKTCQEPFRTADFYVHNDLPYCGQHYHALNGTLCGTCGNGIEGQYLETTITATEGPEKFHPDCFTCCTCRILLNADYYELNGKIYCERDAFRAMPPPAGHQSSDSVPSLEVPNGGRSGQVGARLPPGHGKFLGIANGIGGRTMSGRNHFPERRTTKLMIMGNPMGNPI